MAFELQKQNLFVKRQYDIPIIYKGNKLNQNYRIDLLVNNEVIVELKSIKKIEPIHNAQLLTYLKLANKRYGLLLNFNVPILRHGVKRLLNN